MSLLLTSKFWHFVHLIRNIPNLYRYTMNVNLITLIYETPGRIQRGVSTCYITSPAFSRISFQSYTLQNDTSKPTFNDISYEQHA
jgi:hypothetical protein